MVCIPVYFSSVEVAHCNKSINIIQCIERNLATTEKVGHFKMSPLKLFEKIEIY